MQGSHRVQREVPPGERHLFPVRQRPRPGRDPGQDHAGDPDQLRRMGHGRTKILPKTVQGSRLGPLQDGDRSLQGQW